MKKKFQHQFNMLEQTVYPEIMITVTETGIVGQSNIS